jgi:hypothetical protein
MQRIFKILMQGPLEEDFSRISTRSSHKDLYELQELLTRACTRSCKGP